MGRRATRFDQAYEAVRQRLLAPRNRADPLLSIQEIATALNLSMTPVREAMSRLCGEGALVRVGASYAWPAFDRQDTCDLLDLHLAVILAAIEFNRARADRSPPNQDMPAQTEPGTAPPQSLSPWATEGLFVRLVEQSQRPVLISNQRRLAQQLAPLLPDARLGGSWHGQAHLAMMQADQGGDFPRLAELVSTYHTLLKAQTQ